MSCLWIESAPGRWVPRMVPAGKPTPGEEIGVPGIALLALPRQGAVLLVRPEVWVRVNGDPVLGGMRFLDHKDEILVDDLRVAFSQQGTPTVVPFALSVGVRQPTCPVCRGPVRESMPAVQCPGCARWFHQLDDKKCWSYAPACRFCNHPTAFDDSAAWRPDREECLVRN